ncbi:hypothetical protein BDK51DRAFT_37223 [Blyttiomyces helicus]|uniref:Uncharacterized protein n=1 Tax=Blyttiomyces helicus TaxID=388810 RepID=A0A4V1ISF9_9FUNG|nr:hypothetical protein BDK51DRAFT_37223 [Blyttiomyces helicus]|eukprot:RKO93417.1 hypothetical protein BDK51DRAFT_37223 [Blyttiomyces helicus]
MSWVFGKVQWAAVRSRTTLASSRLLRVGCFSASPLVVRSAGNCFNWAAQRPRRAPRSVIISRDATPELLVLSLFLPPHLLPPPPFFDVSFHYQPAQHLHMKSFFLLPMATAALAAPLTFLRPGPTDIVTTSAPVPLFATVANPSAEFNFCGVFDAASNKAVGTCSAAAFNVGDLANGRVVATMPAVAGSAFVAIGTARAGCATLSCASGVSKTQVFQIISKVSTSSVNVPLSSAANDPQGFGLSLTLPPQVALGQMIPIQAATDRRFDEATELNECTIQAAGTAGGATGIPCVLPPGSADHIKVADLRAGRVMVDTSKVGKGQFVTVFSVSSAGCVADTDCFSNTVKSNAFSVVSSGAVSSGSGSNGSGSGSGSTGSGSSGSTGSGSTGSSSGSPSSGSTGSSSTVSGSGSTSSGSTGSGSTSSGSTGSGNSGPASPTVTDTFPPVPPAPTPAAPTVTVTFFPVPPVATQVQQPVPATIAVDPTTIVPAPQPSTPPIPSAAPYPISSPAPYPMSSATPYPTVAAMPTMSTTIGTSASTTPTAGISVQSAAHGAMWPRSAWIVASSFLACVWLLG